MLITGGAGFIGSHVADRLLESGHEVVALDNLDQQVHPTGHWPGYLDKRVERITADVLSRTALRHHLKGADAVIHLAAKVGVGQSMYDIVEYTRVNCLGTAVLLECIAECDPRPRLVVASSMSIYGQGFRHSGISEKELPHPTSIYAVNKYDQELACLAFGKAYDVPTVALRFFNVYGERQSLGNPYTGVVAIFASRLLRGESPLIFEDGLQTRDFIYVEDVARAVEIALKRGTGEAINIGTGQPTTVLEVATTLAEVLGTDIQPKLLGEKRAGDIRYCYADTYKAGMMLGWKAEVSFREGMDRMVPWFTSQELAVDRTYEAYEALTASGLISVREYLA